MLTAFRTAPRYPWRTLLALALATFLALAGFAVNAAATARAARAYTGTASQYVAVTPLRILDTRDGTGGRLGAVGPASSIVLAIAPNRVPAAAVAVTVNVTVTDTTAQSFLTVWPHGDPLPVASNLNWTPWATVANLVQVGLSGGAVDIYNAQGSASVIVDLEGYYLPTGAAGLGTLGQFRPLMPARIMDTRSGLGHSGQVGAGQTAALGVLGSGNVPSTGVSAVVLNLTVTNGGAPSFLTVFPTGTARPPTSNLNFTPYQTVANRVTIPVGSGGQVSIFDGPGAADVIVDVTGYFTDSTVSSVTGGLFTAVTPARLLDTRNGTGASGPGAAAPGTTLSLQVAGRGGLPSASAVGSAVLNVTSVDAAAPSYLTLFASGDVLVVASDLNFGGAVVPNLVPVRLGADGKVNIYNAAAATQVLADVVGYYSPAPDNGTVSTAPAIGGVVAGDRSATVSWAPPASATTITSYFVTSSPPGGSAAVFGTQTSATVTGLTNKVSYTFVVYATNGVGASGPSGASPAVTPVGTPDAPTGVTAVPSPDSANVCWQSPANDGGSPITAYYVAAWPGPIQVSTTATCFNYAGWLTGGVTYFFAVQALNAFGYGPGANSNLVTPTSTRVHKIVVSLSQQHMWVYQGTTVVMESDVTTGRPALPTPPGDYHIFYRTTPYEMISPWPYGSPYWYPNAWVQWVLEFKEGGYFLHDAPWRSWFGPGSEYGDGTHGCINIPTGVMQWLYSWANIGDEVVVQN